RHPVINLSIDELRDRLSVPEGKLERWFDLYRKAIEPAISQINNNATAAGFTVKCDAVARGRKYERVVFTITKAVSRVDDERSLKARITKTVQVSTREKGKRLAYSVDAALKIIRREAG